MIINKGKQNLGDLFDVKFKVYQYYNEKGEIVKSISKPVDKKPIKQMERKEYTGKFQKNCKPIFMTSFGVNVASLAGVSGFCLFCPPIAFCSLALWFVSGVVSHISAYEVLKKIRIELNNKEFDEKKVISEILFEEEECEKYNKV